MDCGWKEHEVIFISMWFNPLWTEGEGGGGVQWTPDVIILLIIFFILCLKN